ncbi:site-2 protease family protein [bacterium]|nr:site-2 protease family protein [bacterium]
MSIFWIISLIIALTVHEYAHAKTADELGDPTPRITGRLTLNPLAHLDPWGTLALLLFHFGWGKPVQVDVYNLRNPRRDMAIISLAGPLANFLTAIFFSLLWRGVNYFFPFNFSFSYFVFSVVTMNLGLGIFNLLPLGPLDGAKVLLGILPYELAEEWERILSQYGLVLLLLLFLPLPGGTSLLEIIFVPLRDFLLRLLLPFPAGMI